MGDQKMLRLFSLSIYGWKLDCLCMSVLALKNLLEGKTRSKEVASDCFVRLRLLVLVFGLLTQIKH